MKELVSKQHQMSFIAQDKEKYFMIQDGMFQSSVIYSKALVNYVSSTETNALALQSDCR
jgi:hypothetical protein